MKELQLRDHYKIITIFLRYINLKLTRTKKPIGCRKRKEAVSKAQPENPKGLPGKVALLGCDCYLNLWKINRIGGWSLRPTIKIS